VAFTLIALKLEAPKLDANGGIVNMS